MNEDYILFYKSDDRTKYLEFKSDSIVRVNHMVVVLPTYKELKLMRKFIKLSLYETKWYDKNIWFSNSKSVDFRMVNARFFENADLGVVYVLRKFYDEFPDIAVRFESKIFWLDSPETSNGIIKKSGKKNRKLARMMCNKDTTNINTQVYKRYQAFEKFGYEYVFGIIELTEK